MSANNGTKNAYEIRLEVLQLAVSQADSTYHQAVEQARVSLALGARLDREVDDRGGAAAR